MYQPTEALSREALLEQANALLRDHADYFKGLTVDDVEQKGDVLVFKGDFYLDEQGLPTAKSTTVFNLYKYLATELSKNYHLA